MADILPKLNFSADAPNWTGSSRTPSAQDYKANRTMESLFSGVGELVTGATTTAYNYVNEKVTDAVKNGVNPLRDAQGVGPVTQAAPIGLDTPAANLDQSGKKIGNIPEGAKTDFSESVAKLQAAKSDGRIGDSYYYAQLNALTRKLKSQFPGFGDEVDAAIRKETGIVPANALRNAILSDLEKSSTKEAQQEKEDRKYVIDNLSKLPDALRQKILASANPAGFVREVRVAASQWDREDLLMGRNRDMMKLDQEQGNFDSRKATANVQTEINIQTGRAFESAMSALTGPEGIITKALQNNKPLSEGEMAAVRSKIGELKGAYGTMIDKIFDTPNEKLGGKSWSQVINDESKVKQLKESAMSKIARIEAAISDNSFGLAHTIANATSYGRDSKYAELLEKSGFFKAMDVIGNSKAGKELVPVLLARETNGILAKGVQDTIQFMTVTIAGGTQTLKQGLDTIKAQHGDNPAAYNEFLNKNIRLLKEAPPEIAVNVAKSIFNDGTTFQMWKPSERNKAFQMLASPDVTKKMLAIRDSNPEVYNQYAQWSLKAFQASFAQSLDRVNTAVNIPWIDVKYDPKANQFVPMISQEGLQAMKERKATGDPMRWAMATNSTVANYLYELNELNKGMKVVEPILKASDYDVGIEMSSLFAAKGIDPSQPKDKEGFWSKAYKALKNAIQPKKSEGDTDLSPGFSTAFGGANINFQKPSGQDKGTLGFSLDEKNFGTSGKHIPDDGTTMTAKDWNLQFYKPQDLLAKTDGGAWVDARSAKMADALASRFYAETGIRIGVNAPREGTTSGARRGTRDPSDLPKGSAGKGSQHVHGKAFDFQIQNLTDQQKSRFLQLAHEIGFGGVGFYSPGQGGHLHLDTGPMRTWGARPTWADLKNHKKVGEAGSLAGYGLGQ